jgi:hypothetical protein
MGVQLIVKPVARRSERPVMIPCCLSSVSLPFSAASRNDRYCCSRVAAFMPLSSHWICRLAPEITSGHEHARFRFCRIGGQRFPVWMC